MKSSDELIVRRQLGKLPKIPWSVVVRCQYGFPVVIASPAVSDAGLFPTVFWLTCPVLVRAVGELERMRFQEGFIPTSDIGESIWRLWFTGLLGTKMELSFPFLLKSVGGSSGGKVKCLHAELASFLVTERGEAGKCVWERVRRYLYNCKGCVVEDTGR